MNHRATFDFDLEFGTKAEDMLKEALGNPSSVEVKSDRMAWRTGNIVIEYRDHGKPSGIAITKADLWAYVVNNESLSADVVMWFRVPHLKYVARKWFRKPGHAIRGGDDGQMEFVLVPLWDIVPGARMNHEADKRKEREELA